ncbi:beta-ketoacyl synthase N-terminal-like domain-containing protein [Micromonospora sp. M12]
MAELDDSAAVAVVGMAIRVPGAGRDLDRFWRHVHDGVDAVSVFTPEQLDGWGVPRIWWNGRASCRPARCSPTRTASTTGCSATHRRTAP